MGIRVLIADDHEVIRTGLSALVKGSGIEVAGTAATGSQTLSLATELKPDVILLDIRMPGGDGFATLSGLRDALPDTPVVILSTFDSPTYVGRAVELGASGYLLKGSSREELIRAIENAASGRGAWQDEELRKARAAEPTPEPLSDLEVPLTRREVEVLCQVATGLGNKEIARTLHISVETVKEHVHNILGKLNASGRTQAAVWAVRHGLA
jgi:DNA-binding NarL/FixJ family response regulator